MKKRLNGFQYGASYDWPSTVPGIKIGSLGCLHMNQITGLERWQVLPLELRQVTSAFGFKLPGDLPGP